ncbi:major facilitator superfamily domain-containing protein [Fennellomyces sp. T-0311]|nr:major facilitator superfamily domain-containing protein [Fennellomyces sp. T-0311]
MPDASHKRSNDKINSAIGDTDNASEKTPSDKETISRGSITVADVENANEKPFVKSKAEKKLVRKIALTVMPLIVWIAIIQFADKSAISIVTVLGIFQDVHLTGSQFSLLASIFFIGHLVSQPINNILLQKFPVGRLCGFCILLWGSAMLATGYCNTFPQLLAVRFLLGLFEGNSLPSIYLIVNTLFRRSEQATYYGYITLGNGVGIIFQSLVGYGISQMGNQRGIIMWRWLHIILGAITLLLGVLCLFFLVDNPKSPLLRLTQEEKAIVDERIRDNAVVRHKKLKWGQMLEALLEIRFWCICIATLGLNMQGGGLLAFNIIIINGLGTFTPGESILLKIPPGAFMSLSVVLATAIAQRTRQLCYSAIFTCLFSFAGCLILATAEQNVAKLVGLYLTVFWSGSYSIMTTIIGSNVSGYSKKIFYNGALVFCMTIGNIIGPLIMLERQAPRYIGGMTAFCVGNGVALVCFVLIRFAMQRANRNRLANPTGETTDIYMDLTDKEDKNFIYRL